MLNCLPIELAALCCIWSHAQLDRWLNDNQFPAYVSLQLSLIESFFVKLSSGFDQKPILPVDLLVKRS